MTLIDSPKQLTGGVQHFHNDTEKEFIKKNKDRLTVARAMSMISEEDLRKLEFYVVEHEEEIKKFWNIVRVLDCESREFFSRTW